MEQVQLQLNSGLVQAGDFRRIPAPHKHLAFVPQWDFLELLADAARLEPTFTLRMNTGATGLLADGTAVTGVHYRTADGTIGEPHRPDGGL